MLWWRPGGPGVCRDFARRNASLPAEGSSLPAPEGFLGQRSLQQLLTYADNVSDWISAEIIICDSVKVRRGKNDLDRLLCFDFFFPNLFWVMSVPMCASGTSSMLFEFVSHQSSQSFRFLRVLLIFRSKPQVFCLLSFNSHLHCFHFSLLNSFSVQYSDN